MLYIFDEFDKLGGDFLQRAGPLLSAQRREKVSRLRTASQKCQSAAAYLLLLYGLENEYSIHGAAEFIVGKNGKPVLGGYPHIHFNLSHCKTAAACVLSPKPAGVDIQHITPVKDNMARRVLTDEEYSSYRESECPDEYFCRLWTMKEAHLKMTGQGIGADMRDLHVKEIDSISVFQGVGYFCSVTEKDMEILKVSYDELSGKR